MDGADLRFRVLGPLGVQRDGASVEMPRSAVVRGLLGTLLLAQPDPVSLIRLGALVWSARAGGVSRGAIHVGVSRLRDWLAENVGDAAVVHSGPEGYTLRVDPLDVDLGRFQYLVALAAATGDAGHRFDLLSSAMALVRGPVLADVPALDAADPLLRSAADAVRDATLSFAAAAVEAGAAARAVERLETLARERPLDEPVHAQLIELLAASEQPARALVQYDTLRRRLSEDLGVDPGEAVQRAHLAVVQRDRELPLDTDVSTCQLPPDVADFTGNDAAVAEVCRALVGLRDPGADGDHGAPGAPGAPGADAATAPVVVSGQAGVGKTSLVVHAAHLVSEAFPDGQIFVSLGAGSGHAVEPADALGRAMRALGVEDGRLLPDLQERMALYRSALNGKRVLVVLDDAASAAQVRPFLLAQPGTRVLVSTRARLTTLPGAHHVDLGLMSPAEAVALLRRIVGPDRMDAEPDATRELACSCAGLPLALRVAGARLAARPHWAVAQLVERLRDERRRLDELQADDLEVRASLAVSYQGIPAAAQAALRALAFLAGPDFALWTVAALTGGDAMVAGDLIEELLDARLVDVAVAAGPHTRYRMHDLVRLYARERAGRDDAAEELRAAVERVVVQALRRTERMTEQLPIAVPRLYRLEANGTAVHGPVADDRRLFDAEEPALVAAVERAGELGLEELACALADALVFASFAVQNNFHGWNRTHEAALTAARAAGNRHAEAVIECGIGQLRYKEDRFAEAAEHFRRALGLFRAEGHRHGAVVALAGLGTVHCELGEHAVSVPVLREALAGHEELGDERGIAQTHYALGYAHRELGDDERALGHFERALAMYRAAGHRRGEVLAVRGIGLVHRARGDLDGALDWCARAHSLAVEIGDRQVLCYANQALAKVWLRQGDTDRAREPLETALAGCLDLNDRLGAALVRRTLGELHVAAGRPAEALRELTAAKCTWESMGHDLWRARTLRDIGAAQALQGDVEAARESWREAQTIFERLGTRERHESSTWPAAWAPALP